jgi:hypothetical protein
MIKIPHQLTLLKGEIFLDRPDLISWTFLKEGVGYY